MTRSLLIFLALLLGLAACAESQRTPPIPSEARYVASSRGRVYYDINCDAWRRLSPGNLVWFESPGEAETAGYTPSRTAGCGAGEGAELREICTVAAVTDGDTVVCEGGTRVRLLLIDTPEMDQGEFGSLARQHLLGMLPPGTAARVEMDVQREDRYGRALAYLHTPDGRFVNEEMARSGYALLLTYPPNVKHVERIRSAVREAREAGAGLWGTSAFECPPVDHRADRCGP